MSLQKLISIKPDERVVAVYRQYGGVYAGTVLFSAFLFILPFFLVAPLFARGIFGVITFCVLLGCALWYSLRKSIEWYFTMCVVTNRRIVDIDQHGFFDRTVSEVAYQKIQDVSYRIKGVLPTILRYGTVVIQTAGSSAVVELRRMKQPERVADLINEFRELEQVPVVDRRKNEAASLVEKLSPQELDALVQEVKRKDRAEAAEEFFKKEE
ncbi:MAG: PH domain-containing protein [bacterium]|nr:PH domain-containing protein [bacterium]